MYYILEGLNTRKRWALSHARPHPSKHRSWSTVASCWHSVTETDSKIYNSNLGRKGVPYNRASPMLDSSPWNEDPPSLMEDHRKTALLRQRFGRDPHVRRQLRGSTMIIKASRINPSRPTRCYPHEFADLPTCQEWWMCTLMPSLVVM